MTDTIRVGAGCLNQIPLDWAGNRRRILECITQAREADVSVLCLPELAITGYGCEDHFLSHEVAERAWDSLEKIAPETGGMIVAVGLPVWVKNAVFNSVAVLVDGQIAGLVAKQNLAGDGLHYEPRWFQPWPEGVVVEESFKGYGEDVPIGDIIFNLDGIRIALEVCEDAWVADRPGRHFSGSGVDIILNPSASHFAFGKQEVREQFVIEGSRAFGVAYVYANLLGNESGRAIFDGGGLIADHGKITAEGRRFSFEEFTLAVKSVDIERNRLHQARTASRRVDLQGSPEIELSFEWPKVTRRDGHESVPPMSKEEEFTRAMALAYFDYMRKSWSNGFVVSLSGGADSAAVSSFAKIMLDLATAELGAEAVRKRLSYLDLPKEESTWMKQLLFCAYQGTKNSGKVTREAAQAVAEMLGCDYAEWEVDQLVEGYESTVEKVLGRQLSWDKDDLTRQNIQARVRAPGIWMFANLRNGLLLSTSNRSEAAVGYATMDGDTSGGVSPIAGIDKDYLRSWLRWMETTGLPETGPYPALSYINNQQPTAELRPKADKQTDEGDLMPYDVLDTIERAAIRDKKGPKAAMEFALRHHPDHSEKDMKAWVIKFFKLWCRNQWKRERYAVSFHVDDLNLDPKSWCRFPILSSGFAEELAEL
ncbi:NAD(+) synthase [Akkermansiaceae bacterium]|nr:NAD(+) synthase [Akkermansiaceae bacterium]MDB4319355.1 NAD(+) synthase [bacterium]MDA7518514.1 NAD(+) synthase [Akkermansiaceae bacterium]MDA7649081.1 NAD(+) synthase [Akkermansiaceae bacterium]MDA7864088.1 NAD(+) synthase [Akkermansiaceae bacterium]